VTGSPAHDRRSLQAALKALRFHQSSTDELAAIPEDLWPALLDELDREHLTLALGARCADSLPRLARARVERNLRDNAARHDRLVAAHREINDALAGRAVEYVVLKGLSQWPYYCEEPRQRPQYDIDLYVPDESMSGAIAALRGLGYQTAGVTEDPGADHLPVMIRKTGWRWGHNYYDPEMPFSLELHFRFWNPRRMGFETAGTAQFWTRRIVCRAAGIEFPALDTVDGLTYSALHLVRHVLGGDLKLRHVYEMAHFLERSVEDHAFWARWSEAGLRSCRVMEGIAFRLARDWFQCALHPAASAAVEDLPAGVRRWFALFGSAPASLGGPNKNEIWLHFCLLESRRERLSMAARRLFPTRRSRVVRDAHLPATHVGLPLRLRRVGYEASFLAGRAAHHLRAFAPTLRGAYLWCSGKR
jgi:hypothetical protein